MRPSRERIIKDRLENLAEAISIPPGESQLARVANASRVVDFFATDVAFDLERLNIPLNDHHDLREAALAARANLRAARFQFLNVSLKFPESGDTATAIVTLIGTLDQQTNSFARDLKLSLRLVEGKWLIDGVKDVGGL